MARPAEGIRLVRTRAHGSKEGRRLAALHLATEKGLCMDTCMQSGAITRAISAHPRQSQGAPLACITRGPLVDHVQTVITVELLDGVVAHVTGAAEHLPLGVRVGVKGSRREG